MAANKSTALVMSAQPSKRNLVKQQPNFFPTFKSYSGPKQTGKAIFIVRPWHTWIN